MLLQGMEGGWVVIEASHTVRSGLNVTCHMLTVDKHQNIPGETQVLQFPALSGHASFQLHLWLGLHKLLSVSVRPQPLAKRLP